MKFKKIILYREKPEITQITRGKTLLTQSNMINFIVLVIVIGQEQLLRVRMLPNLSQTLFFVKYTYTFYLRGLG